MDVECLPEVRGHGDLGGQDTKPLYPKQQTAEGGKTLDLFEIFLCQIRIKW